MATFVEQRQPAPRLATLPAELLLEIAGYLDVYGALSFKAVSTRMHYILDTRFLGCLAKEICDRKRSYLSDVLQYFNYSALPIEGALRRHTAGFGLRSSVEHIASLYTAVVKFARKYLRINQKPLRDLLETVQLSWFYTTWTNRESALGTTGRKS